MKRILTLILSMFVLCVAVACSNVENGNDIELMGAGDRIHDTYTFANTGVELEKQEDNVYRIYGEVDKLANEDVKEEFEISSDVTHVVALKLSANGKVVDKDKVNIKIDGLRAYDAEHLNGSDYTFIILEAEKNKSVSITISWDGESESNYVVHFDENLILK